MRPTVLVIEDNEPPGEMLTDVLTVYGYHVITVATGQAGLAQVLRAEPAVILLDHILPDATGVDLCHHIHTDLHLLHIPIVLMTVRPHINVACISCTAFLAKPFNIPDLIKVLESVLGSTANRSV